MTEATLTLTDFLLARLAEDEALIRFRTPQIDIGSQRWLAEVEAKRRIVARLQDALGIREEAGKQWVGDLHLNALSLAALDLASVYADHPDFREEWRE